MLQDHGPCHITTILDLYPGEMDRCVDRLNEAQSDVADVADDAAKNAAR
jgi:hypothetical protein